MGEVYRALDTALKREVAIKVLPPQFARDPARLARFEREAQLLASLNHPNIAAIYGLHHVEGVRFLAMELVEGQTLGERLAAAPFEVSEALRLAAQIADALAAAHDKTVVHRDLKPANIKITPEGKVKVLDFGLAKALHEAEPLSGSANSPTVTMGENETRAGTIMGTASYMSPEQAQGKPTDKRSDVWSFGVVLYEMLTRRRAFEGATMSHVIVHVLEDDPDWDALPARVPSGVRDLLGRCLQKDPAERLRDIGDVKLQLLDMAKRAASPKSGRMEVATPSPQQSPAGKQRWLWPTVAALAVLAALALGFVYMRPQKAPDAAAVRFEITQPQNTTFSNALSISPDGKRLAFIASSAGAPRLWVRTLETLESRPLDGTEGATGLPFWSPDSRTIAFSSGGKLKRIEATGGPPQTLCDVPAPDVVLGGFWTRDNKIVFGTVGSGLLQVAPAGGTPSPVTKPAAAADIFPSLLPDGRSFVYIHAQSQAGGDTYLGSLDAKPEEQLARKLMAGSFAFYAASSDPGKSFLLFTRAGTLMAQSFDAGRKELSGEPVPVAEQVQTFSASATGVLVYQTGATAQGSQLTWFDRSGKTLGTAGDTGVYNELAMSPDGAKVAFARADTQTRNMDVWIFEFARGVSTRFTFDKATDRAPVWFPDGSHVVFGSYRGGPAWLYQKASNGAGDDELLFKPPDTGGTPTDWSRDGRYVLYNPPAQPTDIWMLALGNSGDHKAVPLVKTPANERGARFSPDGRWFAYTSNESGVDEVYVRQFDPASPESGGKWMVSKGGGGSVRWRKDGKELFYINVGEVMAVDVSTSPVFQAGIPKALFKMQSTSVFWDVAPDGQRFLLPIPVGANSPAPYKVVLNWTSTLKR
jgi:serine/threonine protein kinase